MSRELAMDVIHLRPTSRVGHTEYCSHEPLVRLVTGKDPRTDGSAWQDFNDAWDLDMLWCTNDGPVDWSARGRVTDMGHAIFLEDGRDRREAQPSPFRSPTDVWSFDAVQEYGLPDFEGLVKFYEECTRTGQEAHPQQLVTAGYYKTIVSGAIQSFGWEMLLEAAADRRRFERTLDSIFQISLHHFRAWARTQARVFICHDDMVWTEGAFMHPDFYRHAIFPRYEVLWSELKKAGMKVLFCSDGDFTEFVEDIAQAGADGFIFEPMVDFDHVVERFGDSHVIVGSKVDCRTLTFGREEDILREIEATFQTAKRCRGHIFAVGNHIPSNVPVANALYYMKSLRQRWGRSSGGR